MNKIVAGCLAGGLLVSLSTVGSAAAGQARGKTFTQTFEAAKSARLSVRIASAEMDVAAARVAQAKAQFYPTLDFSSNVDRIHNHDTFSGVTASVEIPELNTTSKVAVAQTVPRYLASAGLTARYNVYTGGRVQAQLNQEELSLQAAEVSRQLALQQVALDVSSAYFKLRRACMRVSSASRQLQHAQAVADLANQRLHEGRIAPIEENVSALTLTEKRSAWRSRQEDLELAYAGYRESTQNTLPEEEGTEERCRFANSIEDDLGQARQLSDQTLDARYENLKLDAARERVAVYRASLRPQVSLYANHSGIGRSDSSLGNSLSEFHYRQSGVGLQVTFNLFDSGFASQRVSEAEADVRKQALLAEQAAADREQHMRRRELSARMVETRIDLLRSRLKLATAKADMARQQLKAGTISASVAEESIERERDARDELDASQIDAVLANLAALFPSRTLQEQ